LGKAAQDSDDRANELQISFVAEHAADGPLVHANEQASE
jgi:hypothetical protein